MRYDAPWGISKGHHHLATPELNCWKAAQQGYAAVSPTLTHTQKWVREPKTADKLPRADQRRMAWVFSANGRFANSFGEGAPLRSTPFSNDEFQAGAQMRYGVRITCLMSSTDLPPK